MKNIYIDRLQTGILVHELLNQAHLFNPFAEENVYPWPMILTKKETKTVNGLMLRSTYIAHGHHKHLNGPFATKGGKAQTSS